MKCYLNNFIRTTPNFPFRYRSQSRETSQNLIVFKFNKHLQIHKGLIKKYVNRENGPEHFEGRRETLGTRLKSSIPLHIIQPLMRFKPISPPLSVPLLILSSTC